METSCELPKSRVPHVEVSEEAKAAQEVQDLHQAAFNLQKELEYYRDKNAELEETVCKLRLMGLCPRIQQQLDKVIAIQQQMKNIESSGSESLAQVQHRIRLRKQGNYLAKLKVCIKMYNDLNEKLCKEIRCFKTEVEQSKNSIGLLLPCSEEDLKILQSKVSRYEKELFKFEKKYPWLKDPQFNAQNIAKELEILDNLRHEKAKLLEELSSYRGLKPDILEAKKQLIDAKEEYSHVLESLLLHNAK